MQPKEKMSLLKYCDKRFDQLEKYLKETDERFDKTNYKMPIFRE